MVLTRSMTAAIRQKRSAAAKKGWETRKNEEEKEIPYCCGFHFHNEGSKTEMEQLRNKLVVLAAKYKLRYVLNGEVRKVDNSWLLTTRHVFSGDITWYYPNGDYWKKTRKSMINCSMNLLGDMDWYEGYAAMTVDTDDDEDDEDDEDDMDA